MRTRHKTEVEHEVTEHKHAEEKLRRLSDVIAEEKDRLQALVNSIDDEIWFADTEGRFTWVNPSGAREFALGAADATDVAELAGGLEVYRPDGSPRPVEESPALRALQGEAVRKLEEIVRTPVTGELRYRQVSSSPVRNAAGSIIGSVSVVRDVTEQKQAEEALRKARDDLEIRIRERTAELFLTNEQLREENEERLRTELSLRLDESRLEALLRLGQMSETSAREISGFVLEQGIALTQSEIGFVGFLSEDESVYTLHAVSKDVVKGCEVTGDPLQWHIAEAGIWADAIRQRKTLFINDYSKPHPAKKGLPPGHPGVERFMVVPVLDGTRIVAIAGVANKASDYDTSDERQIALLLGGMWNYVQRSRSRQALQEAYEELERRVEQRTAALAESNAALQAEIRERRKAEEALTRAKKQAEEAAKELARSNRDLEQFAYAVSHDLQEPLRAVTGFVGLLRDRYRGRLDPKAEQHMDFAMDGATRMSDMIRDLLAYSRVGTHRRQATAASCRDALEGALANLGQSIEASGSRVSHDDLPTVYGDPTQITMLFQNLIGNAIKFRREGLASEVHVAARQEGGQWVIGVRDNGIGIPPEHYDLIFRVFERLHNREAYPGTGIGLAVCKKIVESHGGRIWVESKVGEGTTFFFTLRAVEAVPA